MKFYVTSLGGIGEIGLNMYVYETETTAVIVDCGVKFANPDDPSIDLIIPDFSYLEKIKDKLTCVVLTHSHEDHVGALPYLLKKYPLPIAASRYSMALIDHKLKDHAISAEKTYLEPMQELTAGDITITFIPVSHSIHGTGALLIDIADTFTCLHISDYKIDFAPITCSPFNARALLEASKRGLTCLFADSTNCAEESFTKSERTAAQGIDSIFAKSKGRIFFTTFASNTERLQSVFDAAVKHGRKIAIEGSSMLKNIETARSLSYLKAPADIIIPRKSIERLPDAEVCVIATGSQGELMSVISKISKNDYGKITVREGDTFIFSSRVIPGNEQCLINIMNNIASYGGSSVTVFDAPVHVSGHAAKEDARLLLNLTRPDYLIPIHGERIHLNKHKELALESGMADDNIIISKTGMKMCFEDGVYMQSVPVESGKMFVDSKQGYLLTLEELKHRKKLSSEGVAFVFADVDLTSGRLKSSPKVGMAGFAYIPQDIEELKNTISAVSETEVFERFNKDKWHELIHTLTKRFFKRKFGRKPIINITLDT